ncbi:DUF1697 domain-containing protein [Sphingobacterium kyonggiense]
MKSYIIFLRAVNVSGKNIIKMSALKSILEEKGFQNVVTYIQSGNIYLNTDLEKNELESLLHQLIKDHFQLDISCFIIEPAKLEQVIHDNPYCNGEEPNRVFITFLDTIPDSSLIAELKAIDYNPETFFINKDILYYHLPMGMAKSKFNNNFFEKKLKLIATGRNVNTVLKMHQLLK